MRTEADPFCPSSYPLLPPYKSIPKRLNNRSFLLFFEFGCFRQAKREIKLFIKLLSLGGWIMKQMRLITLLCFAVLFTLLQLSLVSAATLADYPSFFTERSSDRPYVVVGQYAPAQDVVTASEVAVVLQRELLRTNGHQFRYAKLDNELRDVALNLVVVGSAQDNDMIGRLLDTDSDNPFNLHSGEALVTLLHVGGKYQLIITGYTTREVAKAGDLVAQFKGYRRLFVGKEIRIKNGRVVPSDDQQRYINPGLQLVVPDAIRRVPLDPASIRLPGIDNPAHLNQRIPVPVPARSGNADSARDDDQNDDTNQQPSDADALPARNPIVSGVESLPARQLSDSEQAWEDMQNQGSSDSSDADVQPIVVVRSQSAQVSQNVQDQLSPRTVQQINSGAMIQNPYEPQFVAGAHFYEQRQRRYVVG